MRKAIDEEVVRMNLKIARIKAGLTQAEAADKVGISRQTLVGYESDPANITFKVFKRFANVYGCEMGFFFGF